jgi:putative transposase
LTFGPIPDQGWVWPGLRIEFEGALYHLLARGNNRQTIFESDADPERFVRLLAESAERFDVAVQAFVLMGNHFHLVAQTRRANLSRWMHWLMVAYSVYFNRRHRRSGHLCKALQEPLGGSWRLPACAQPLSSS